VEIIESIISAEHNKFRTLLDHSKQSAAGQEQEDKTKRSSLTADS
jgi:hypothetical protein